jgi:hypothetical protein
MVSIWTLYWQWTCQFNFRVPHMQCTRGVYIPVCKNGSAECMYFRSVHKQSDNGGTYFDQDLIHDKCVEQD